MKCIECNELITNKQLFVKEENDEGVFSYHINCHINKFGDIMEEETKLAQINSRNINNDISKVSNALFLVLLTIVNVCGLAFIIVLF